jgi:hypothetical protein
VFGISLQKFELSKSLSFVSSKLLHSFPYLCITIELFHGDERLVNECKQTVAIPSNSTVTTFDSESGAIGFDSIRVDEIALGTVLAFRLRGLKHKNSDAFKASILGWANVKVFDFMGILKNTQDKVAFWIEQNSSSGIRQLGEKTAHSLSFILFSFFLL